MAHEVERNLSRLRRETAAAYGKCVFIHNTEIAGLSPDWDEAIEAGYERYQLNGFKVREIGLVEFYNRPPVRVSFLSSCRFPYDGPGHLFTVRS